MIRYAPYELVARRALNARATELRRRGALIEVDGGYADVHPWSELGDAPLDEQLAMLARGETTSLTRASLRFAAGSPTRSTKSLMTRPRSARLGFSVGKPTSGGRCGYNVST
ncbi:MAG: hypothetical protein JWO97_1375, partial [Acidobacteria bacterium]|nr:hypothetical protein [Acidobacteriota bacterium]